MKEKDIENLLAFYPDEFFPKSGFKLIGQQVRLGRCRADIIFEDKYNRKIIIEVKRGILSRDASGQIIEYYGLLKQENPDTIIELILCANVVPPERKMFLENVGIECKALGLGLITRIAKKYNYRFLDEPSEELIAKDLKVVSTSEEITLRDEGKQRVWIFQANPNRYDILNALADKSINEETWLVNRHKNDIKKGDTALIWMSGKDSGIYAVADVTSDPDFLYDNPSTEKYWIDEKDKRQKKLRVTLRIVKSLLNCPVFRIELKKIKKIENLSILNYYRGTNFPVTNSEWEIIKQLIES